MIFALGALAACGPIHPRWVNNTSHEIVVTYLHGKDSYRTSIRAGKIAVPRTPFDFQSIDAIKVEDAGEVFNVKRDGVLRLHEACGHGYACYIKYAANHEMTVSGHKKG